MVKYVNARGRVVVRSAPDPRLESSRRWARVRPIDPIPAPERAPEHDGLEPSEKEE